MKKHHHIATGSLVLALFAPSAAADFFSDMVFVPSAGIGYKTLSLDEDFTSYSGSGNNFEVKGDIESTYLNMNLGITAASGPYYTSFSIDQQLSVEEESNDVPFAETKADVERDDLTLTFGYNLNDTFTVFLGYKKGETELIPEPRSIDAAGLTNADKPLTFLPFPQDDPDIYYNVAYGDCCLVGPEFAHKYKQNYEEDGFFIGAGFSMPVLESGSLSVSVAYAFMDAEYNDNTITIDKDGIAQFFDYDGDTNGGSFGAKYSHGLTDTIALYGSFKWQFYEFEGRTKPARSAVKVTQKTLMRSLCAEWTWMRS